MCVLSSRKKAFLAYTFADSKRLISLLDGLLSAEESSAPLSVQVQSYQRLAPTMSAQNTAQLSAVTGTLLLQGNVSNRRVGLVVC